MCISVFEKVKKNQFLYKSTLQANVHPVTIVKSQFVGPGHRPFVVKLSWHCKLVLQMKIINKKLNCRDVGPQILYFHFPHM